jgi:hypothetical protein
VKVRHDEGGSEPHRPRAVRCRSQGRRRSVGRGGRRPAIEPRNPNIPGADAVSKAEGNTAKHDIARLGGPGGSKNLACVEAP